MKFVRTFAFLTCNPEMPGSESATAYCGFLSPFGKYGHGTSVNMGMVLPVNMGMVNPVNMGMVLPVNMGMVLPVNMGMVLPVNMGMVPHQARLLLFTQFTMHYSPPKTSRQTEVFCSCFVRHVLLPRQYHSMYCMHPRTGQEGLGEE